MGIVIEVGGGAAATVPETGFPFAGSATASSSGVGPDNSAALTAALAAVAAQGGGTIKFGGGRYAFASSVTITQSNITLEGNGATVFIAASGSDYNWMLQSASGSNVTLRNITFDANKANRPAPANALGCIRLTGQTDLLLDGITVQNTTGSAIGGEAVGCQIQATRCRIDNCAALDCGSVGTNLSSDGFFVAGTDIECTNYIAKRCTDTGYVMQLASHSSLANFVMIDCQAGFAMGPAGASDQVGNVVSNGIVTCTIGATATGAKTIAGASAATPCRITCVGHGFSANDFVYISGVSGVPAANGARKVIAVDADHFDIKDLSNVNVAGVGAYVSGGIAQPTFQAVGFDIGTYGAAADSGELRDVLVENVVIDNRTNIGSHAISFWAGNVTAPPTAKAVTGATNATPIVVTAVAHGYVNGQIVATYGITGNTAANGRFIVANKAADTFELTDLNGNSVAGNGAYASGGFAQAGSRSRNIRLKNINVVTANPVSYAMYVNNAENIEISGCSFDGEGNPTVAVDARCADVRFHHNQVIGRTGATFGMRWAPGGHRLQVDCNTIRGLDGTTVNSIYFDDTSTEVYARRNLITGCSAGSVPVSAGATTINQDEVDLVSAQTVGGAKRFSSPVSLNQAAGAAQLSITTSASNMLGVSIVPSSNAAGVGFGANGEFGGLSHDVPTASGVIRYAASVRGDIGLTSGNYPWTFTPAAFFRLNADGVGAFGVGSNGDPSASHALFLLSAGNASYSPMKFTPGTAQTSPADGCIDFTTTNMLATIGGTRYDLVRAFGTTTTAIAVSSAALAAGGTTSNTGTVTGAAVGDHVDWSPSTGTPPDAGTVVDAFVSSANTVTVRVTAITAQTTSSLTYNVRVVKKP